jgi:hypothetical protein
VIPGEKDAEHTQIFSLVNLVNAETGEHLRDYESAISGVHPLACTRRGVHPIHVGQVGLSLQIRARHPTMKLKQAPREPTSQHCTHKIRTLVLYFYNI